MKTLAFFFFIIPVLAIGQCDPAGNGTLSANVQCNSVILSNDTVYRNCGASYSMGISWLSNDTLIWIQTDTGDVAYCQCHFDLSVTIGYLSQGNYTASVYYSNPIYTDTCFIGMVSFSVIQPENFPPPEIINHFQSACFTVSAEEMPDLSKDSPWIYPNPAGDKLFFSANFNGEPEIQISDVKGLIQCSYSFDRSQKSIDIHDLKPGLYIVRILQADQINTIKFIKM